MSVLAAAALLAGCGGSDSASPTTTTESTAAATRPAGSDAEFRAFARRAERVCERSVRETRALGDRIAEVISHSASPQEGITNGLVKPGIQILSQEGDDLRSLTPTPASRELEVFLGLFDPIVELARQRLQAGSSGEPERARRLELIIAGLEDERSAAAQRLGLRVCSVQFTRALGGPG